MHLSGGKHVVCLLQTVLLPKFSLVNINMLQEENIQVALAFDEPYAVHGSTTILSIIENASNRDVIHLHVLDTGLTQETRHWITQQFAPRLASLTFHRIDSDFLATFPVNFHPASAYARFALPELLPEVSKILYVDSDLIVLESLSKLFNADLDGKPLAAVPDVVSHFRGSAVPYLESLGLPEYAVYFNSGVMILDLEQWRRDEIVESLRGWISMNESLMQKSDQSALNALLWEDCKLLPLRWNLQVAFVDPVRFGWGCTREQADAVSQPAIVHYITNRKPWRREFRVPFAHYYWHYRDLLGWKVPAEDFPTRKRLHRAQEELVALWHRIHKLARACLGRIPEPNG